MSKDNPVKIYFKTQCPECLWIGISRDCIGDNNLSHDIIFDDFGCPECIKKGNWVQVNAA